MKEDCIAGSKNKLIIIGAGGHGKVVADIAVKMNSWKQIVFLEDDESITSSFGIDVIGKSVDVYNYISEYDVFVAIGNNKTREKMLCLLEEKGASIPKLIHPNTVISEWVEIGNGTVVMAGTVINCYSKIGKGCIINTGATIDHENIIGDYVHLSPGVHLAGTVTVGKNTWMGIGSTAVNNINITMDCIIGAGAVITNDISEAGTYIGVPARRLSK